MMCLVFVRLWSPTKKASKDGMNLHIKKTEKKLSCFAKIQTLLDSEKPQSRKGSQEKTPFFRSPSL